MNTVATAAGLLVAQRFTPGGGGGGGGKGSCRSGSSEIYTPHTSCPSCFVITLYVRAPHMRKVATHPTRPLPTYSKIIS